MVVTRHFRQPEFLTFLNAFVPPFQMVLIKFFEKPEYLPKNHKNIILIKVAFCQYGKIRPVYYIPAVRNSTQRDLQACGRPPIYNLGGRNSPFFISFSYINPFQLHGPDFYSVPCRGALSSNAVCSKSSSCWGDTSQKCVITLPRVELKQKFKRPWVTWPKGSSSVMMATPNPPHRGQG